MSDVATCGYCAEPFRADGDAICLPENPLINYHQTCLTELLGILERRSRARASSAAAVARTIGPWLLGASAFLGAALVISIPLRACATAPNTVDACQITAHNDSYWLVEHVPWSMQDDNKSAGPFRSFEDARQAALSIGCPIVPAK